MKINPANAAKTDKQASKKKRREVQRAIADLLECGDPASALEGRLLATGAHVPKQDDCYSCGYNSTARSLALLGHPIADYKKYVSDAPYYPGKTSGCLTPKALAKHVNKSSGVKDVQAVENHPATWSQTLGLLDGELEAGRPVIPLIRNGDEPESISSQYRMHYFIIADKENAFGTTYYTVLDTHGAVYLMSADELQDRMKLGGPLQSVMRGLGLVHKFNLLTFKQV